MPPPTAPAYQGDVDLGQSLRSGLQAITDPALRDALFAATEQDLGRYGNLYNRAATQQAFGQGSVFDANKAMQSFTPEVAAQLQAEHINSGDPRPFGQWLQGWAESGAALGDPSAIRILEESQSYDPDSDVGRALDASTAFSQAERESASAGRRSTMEDVISLAPQLNDIFRNANPELQSALTNATAMGGSQNFFGNLEGAISGAPQFGDVGFNAANAPQAGQANTYGAAMASNVAPTASQGYDAAMMQAAPDVSAQQVQANAVGSGALGDSLYNQALGTGDLGETGQALQNRAMGFANSTGELSSDELRQLQQSIREGYADRGTLDSSGAVTAEALGRLTNTRERMLQDLGMASSLNQAGQQETAQNRAFRQGVQGQDIGRQQSNAGLALSGGVANQGAGLQASLANQGVAQQANAANQNAANQAGQFGASAANQAALTDSGIQANINLSNQNAANQARQFGASAQNTNDLSNLAMAGQYGLANQSLEAQLGLANRQFGASQAQQGISNQAMLAQLFSGQNEQDRNYALNMVNAQQASSIDPWQALTGVGSMAPQMGAGSGQQSYGNISGITGSNMFDPSVGTNLALMNSANRAGYDANTYASDAAMYGANKQASATKGAGIMGAVGSIGSAALIAF